MSAEWNNEEDELEALAYTLSLDGYIGALRLKDGLFLGDVLAAVDSDFFSANIVLFVVNCTPLSETKNHFEDHLLRDTKIQYLNLDWLPQDHPDKKVPSPFFALHTLSPIKCPPCDR